MLYNLKLDGHRKRSMVFRGVHVRLHRLFDDNAFEDAL